MTRAKLAVGTFLALAIACGDSATSGLFSDGKDGDDEKAGSDSRSPEGNGVLSPAPSAVGSPAATGVVLTHSATFPAYRLCFENYPEMLPQPDAKVMPGANVVGVETGGAVRINALTKPPGRVYVIDESAIRYQSGEATALPCGRLIPESVNPDAGGPRPPDSLKPGADYFRATKVESALGVDTVVVLTIAGCGDDRTIRALDGVLPTPGHPLVANCGADWDSVDGNLKANVVELGASGNGPTDGDIPVSLFKLAAAADALAAPVTVKFGPAGSANVEIAPGKETRVAVDQTKEASYGELGFEVTATVGGVPVTTRQTLADVQQLSAPGDVPTTYYRAASNYALLVLGDPSHREKGDGGVDNVNFNPRRALHIVAVPVLDPTKLPDGGTDGGDTDSGIR